MNSVIRLCCCINRVSSTNPAFCGESIQDLLEENGSFRADITLFPRLALCPPSSGAMLKSAAISHLCEDHWISCAFPLHKMAAVSSSAW